VSSDGGATWTTFADGVTTSTIANVTGLTNGTDYVFRVAAINAIGVGAYTAASSSATPGFDPASVAGLQAWYDASDAFTLYDATSGGSPVAADGAVARWQDKSGNARHATQATSGSRPARKTAVQGGRDVLRFDGSNDFFSLSAVTTTSSYTSFFVFRRERAGIHSVSLGPETLSGNYTAWWFSDNVVYESSNGTVNFTTHGSANTSTGAFLLATTRTGTTSIATRRNGSALATVTSGAGVTNPASGSWSAIGRGDGAPTFHNGDICEIILYDSALSDSSRAEIESYLMAKWGIS
jgi:hypothetical protein